MRYRNSVKNFSIKIAGTTHRNEDGTPRMKLLVDLYDNWWTEGYEDEIELEFREEPENPYDEDAVGVWCVKPERASGRLGFVPRDRTRVIKLAIRARVIRGVRFGEMHAGGGGSVWGRLRVTVGRGGQEDQ